MFCHWGSHEGKKGSGNLTVAGAAQAPNVGYRFRRGLDGAPQIAQLALTLCTLLARDVAGAFRSFHTWNCQDIKDRSPARFEGQTQFLQHRLLAIKKAP